MERETQLTNKRERENDREGNPIKKRKRKKQEEKREAREITNFSLPF